MQISSASANQFNQVPNILTAWPCMVDPVQVGKHLGNNLTFVGAVWRFSSANQQTFKSKQVDFQKQLNCFDSCKETNKTRSHWLKFIYSEKATNFCEISTVGESKRVWIELRQKSKSDQRTIGEVLGFIVICYFSLNSVRPKPGFG